MNLEDTIDLLDEIKASPQGNGSPSSSITHSANSNPEPLIVLDESIVGSDFSAPRGQQVIVPMNYIIAIYLYLHPC